MAKLRAVLLDLDGTLRDSREAINPALGHALQIHGIQAQPEDIAPHVHSLRAVHEALAREVRYEDLEAAYDRSVSERLHTIKLYEHVPETLRWLRGNDIAIGMVSSARRARDYLVQEGLIEYFDVVVGGNDVKEPKPDPQGIQLALGALACEPGETVMIGDLSADIVAGKAAGLGATVGLTHGFGTRQVLEEAGADYIIDSLAELPDVLATSEQK